MQDEQRRSDFRVAVPEGSVRELALWFCPDRDFVRLSVAELGQPELALTRLGSGRMAVADLSIRGMGLLVDFPQLFMDRLVELDGLLAYLQLWDPSAEDPHGVLSVFVHCHLARLAPKDDGYFLGTRFVRFAVASRHEKAMEFRDAERCGVGDLARWCDNVARGLTFTGSRPLGGLDMDHLLAEIAAPGDAAAPEPEHHSNKEQQ